MSLFVWLHLLLSLTAPCRCFQLSVIEPQVATGRCVDLQMTVGPNGITLASEAGPAGPSGRDGTRDSFDEALHQLSGNEKGIRRDLERYMRSFLLETNKSIAKGAQGRQGRFMRQRVLDANKQADEDGYMSDDDCIAVLFDTSDRGPRRKNAKRQYKIFYGNATKLTIGHKQKRVPVPRARLMDKSAIAACNWFAEKKANGQHLTHEGKKAYHLPIRNAHDIN